MAQDNCVTVRNPSSLGVCTSDCDTGNLDCNKCDNSVTVVFNPQNQIVQYVRFYTVASMVIVITLLRKYILQTALALEYARRQKSCTLLVTNSNIMERREVA